MDDIDEETYDFIFKTVIVGDSGVGKTGIVNRFLHNKFDSDTKSTVGVEFGTKKITIDGKNLKAQIWDTAGQERYRSITNAYYKGAKGALVVYDITSRSSFDNVDRWISEIKSSADIAIYLVLVGNKSDLNENREISIEEGKQKSANNGIAFMETSAKTSENIEEVFNLLTNEIYQVYKENEDFEEMFEEKIDLGGNNISQETSKKKNGCCN